MHNSRRPRILLIDDEPLIGNLIARMLGSDFEVERAADGQRALDLLRDNDDFDLVLCDLMMPGLTGMEVYEALVARHSPHVAKMIFLTGGAFVGEAGHFLVRVPNPCLEKPFLAADLRAAVRAALGPTALGSAAG